MDRTDPDDLDAGALDALPLGSVGWVLGLSDGVITSDVRHALLRRVAEEALPLAELRLLVPSLGEIYRRAVEGEADADERAAQESIA